MLDPFSRGTMVALSALCVSGAVGLATQSARSSTVPPFPPLARRALSVAPHRAGEAVIRDPFAEPLPPVSAAAPVSAGVSPALGNAEQLGGDASGPRPDDGAGALPSNLPHDTIPALPGAAAASPLAARITAIVTGAHPYAMVETGGVHAIKGLGDRLDGIAITAIDITGIALANGGRLRVDAAARP